jgi:uncharacterized protein (TIGR03000 family)
VVWVPPDAQVWFDDAKTTQAGPAREFVTPAMPVNVPQTYQIRAVWNENGKSVEQTQAVEVAGGRRVVVRFPTNP